MCVCVCILQAEILWNELKGVLFPSQMTHTAKNKQAKSTLLTSIIAQLAREIRKINEQEGDINIPHKRSQVGIG